MILAKANSVNELLEAQGRKVVQEIIIGNKPVRYGYKPQYVIDAVNEVFHPENWYYQLHATELFTTDENSSGQVVVSVELFLRSSPESEFFSHGPQFGQSQVVYGNVGDAKKGAVTDAIQKNLSLFSIGKAAYRGELEAVYKSNKRELPKVTVKQKPDNAPPPESEKQDESSGLPELPNVTYDHTVDGIVLAKGDTYTNRVLLKSLGFVWLPKEKGWGLLKAA